MAQAVRVLFFQCYAFPLQPAILYGRSFLSLAPMLSRCRSNYLVVAKARIFIKQPLRHAFAVSLQATSPLNLPQTVGQLFIVCHTWHD
ncbi:hypothetical protein FKP32DRAFT_532921 [Trametes sanguinea]|nr:hypothetical protein FKP32DRAFT_532921 [Trametes sanguinea]